MNFTGIITQARLGSTRLPGKVLKEMGGKTVLDHHLDRLKQSGFPVFVATTDRPADDALQRFCQERDIPCFRGDEEDVLDRFYGCARQFQLKTIVRVTSDCPLIDGEMIGKALKAYQEWNDPSIYLSNVVERTYPRGFDFEIFSFELLEMAHREASLPGDREHVTPFLHQNRNGKVKLRHWTRPADSSGFRITLDTAEDFQALSLLIEQHQAQQGSGEEIIALLQAHPEIVALNREVKQKGI
jgi:spore coat polysaccharide biosynthesis protein SpsF